jgi:hypothetical protein
MPRVRIESEDFLFLHLIFGFSSQLSILLLTLRTYSFVMSFFKLKIQNLVVKSYVLFVCREVTILFQTEPFVRLRNISFSSDNGNLYSLCACANPLS